MKRVAIVIGTRPEAIKLAPVAHALRALPGIETRVIATAQHREMLDDAFAETGLTADIDLDLMERAQTLSAFSARCLGALGDYLDRDRPDYVIGQGDTSTVHAAAWAAHHARIPFGHVEAGLRSGDPATPFPEEMNRRVVSLLACHHFCPTAAAKANLLRERVPADAIHVTGNTVIDTLLKVASTLPPRPSEASPTILVTVHRRESFEALAAITGALIALLDRFPELTVRWPVHPNPHIGHIVRAALGTHPRVVLSGPLPYRAFIKAMRDARVILTDSGGVQEEAPSLGTPVLVLRTATERPEAVLAGVARLIGTKPEAIISAAAELLGDDAVHARMARIVSPYGDGLAGKRIAEFVHRHLTGSIPSAPQLRSPVATG